jgi:hypothetical protein
MFYIHLNIIFPRDRFLRWGESYNFYIPMCSWICKHNIIKQNAWVPYDNDDDVDTIVQINKYTEGQYKYEHTHIVSYTIYIVIEPIGAALIYISFYFYIKKDGSK